MKKSGNFAVITIIAVMLIAVIAMELTLVFRMTSEQTKESGRYCLESISGELENTINEAENFTMRLAVSLQPYIDDKEKLSGLIYDKVASLDKDTNSAFNIYIAGKDWSILPGLADPENFDPVGRDWYKGAVKNKGQVYVTPPYRDVVTGNMCYTVSVLLDDEDTVLSVDYTTDSIQSHVAKMTERGLHNAVIVTEDGIIAGCTEEAYIGDLLSSRLPEYSAVFHLAKTSDDFVTRRIKSGFFYENLFAAGSSAGWYLIVNQSDWELYRNSYIQLAITLILTLALTAVIIVLYVAASRNRRKAEEALKSKDEFLSGIKGELETPIRKILSRSDSRNYPDNDTAEERFSGIHDAGEQLSYQIQQILSYSNIVKNKEKKEKKKSAVKEGYTFRINKRFRNIILTLMIIVLAITVTTTMLLSRSLARVEMSNDVSGYENQLSEWVNKQKSILDMLAGIIAINSEMLDDYDGTIQFLDKIASRYPEISVLYMTNPDLTPTVYMNNGWLPDDDWHVEERQWYKDTLASDDGWSISAPYYDEQTGFYCVTISEQVRDAVTGRFIGNLGIDFYMDKLTDILSTSYSEKGYAFITDAGGNIINHPYGTYQMSENNTVNVSELRCSELNPDGESTMVYKDYDGSIRIFTAKRSDKSNFVVYKATDIWVVYGRGFIVGLFCLVSVSLCIVIVSRLLSKLIHWQDGVNRRMKEAAESATAAGVAKGKFLAQMSHEIRTPINAVLGMNEMILNESHDQNILEYSSSIQTAGRTLLSLINSILDFSKIEDGKMELVTAEYDTVSVINNLLNSVSTRAKDKGLEFTDNIDNDLPCKLIGDDVRLTQVIMNLLTNAVKYTEKGSVLLTISCVEKNEKDLKLFVSVKDTGIGIREEDMDKLFESFSRLDETRNRNIEGTGLGMAIVTKLLDLMNSKLRVESVYGVGSTFSFEVVQGIADSRPIGNVRDRRVPVTPGKVRERPVFPDAAVLVTDDNEMNLKVAKNLLKLFGVVPELASSGEQTIEIMRKKHFDIVFLDHMMPKMDGIETLKRLKEDSLIPADTVVIALTANAVNGAKENYLKAGFDDYLSKPIETPALEEKLARYLFRNSTEARDKPVVTENGADDEVMEFMPVDDYEVMEFMPGDTEVYDKTDGRNKHDIIARLSDAGISTGEGLSYCASDEDFYLDILRDYVKTSDDRTGELEKEFADKDIENYEITVHALKSISKTVGADDISTLAKELEGAAKRGDMEYITLHHSELIGKYHDKVAKIDKIISD